MHVLDEIIENNPYYKFRYCDTNLMKESMVLETISNICHILIMQLNYSPDKYLMITTAQSIKIIVISRESIAVKVGICTCSCTPGALEAC